VAVCGLAALSAADASAAVVSFQQGVGNALVANYSGTRDTFLNEGATEASYGALTVSIGGHDPTSTPATRRTALLRFDLSALQGQFSSINAATLTLYQRETTAQFTDFEVGAYSVSAANGGWVQGVTDTSAPNTAGNPDWLHLSHDATPWAGSPGLMTPGVDYDATPLSTVTWNSGVAGTADKQNAQYTFTLPPSLIAAWAAGDNPGLLIRTTDPAVFGLAQFAAAEWNTDPDSTGPLTAPDIRPKLTVDFTAVPEPAGLSLLAVGALALTRHRRRK
jgi:hypothetical protein